MGLEFYTREKIQAGDTDQPLPASVAAGFGRFTDLEAFAEGGSCRLFSGKDPVLGRRVAIKILHPESSGNETDLVRFVREARVTAQIQHPNTVPVYELGRDGDGIPYFTMKHVHGETLREIIDRLAADDPDFRARYPVDTLLEILIQVGLAIAFAHDRGVIHRDLKPANILVGDFGEVVVLDWGLAKLIGQPEEAHVEAQAEATAKISLALTQAGNRYGTPLYMSPEQAAGEAVQPACDIYLLGNLLYEILTHKSLVWGRTADEIIEKILRDPIIPPRKRARARRIPPELDAICMKALAREPADRYASAMAMVEDLRLFRLRRRVSVYRESTMERLARGFRRELGAPNALLLMGLAALIGAAAGFAAAWALLG